MCSLRDDLARMFSDCSPGSRFPRPDRQRERSALAFSGLAQAMLAMAARSTRRKLGEVVRLIDSTGLRPAGTLSHGSHDQVRQHLATFRDAYNVAKRLKTLRGLTP